MSGVGQIAGIWRYPVKSMLGEQLDEVLVEDRGLAGDRLYAMREPDGKLGSGKSTRRFRAIEGLFRFSAAYEDGDTTPVITLPDGARLRGDDATVDGELSRLLKRDVSLAREAEVSHFDRGPIHVLTTASLRCLQRLLPNATLDPRRFRPNILLETGGVDFLEDGWLGRRLILGQNVELRVTERTERCIMTTFGQSELPADPTIFRAIANHNALCLGVYATATTTGAVQIGDEVTLTG